MESEAQLRPSALQDLREWAKAYTSHTMLSGYEISMNMLYVQDFFRRCNIIQKFEKDIIT